MTNPLFLFAPGAGAPSTHRWMQHWKGLLETIGPTHTFDYDYMRSGSRRPDPFPMLVAAHHAALAKAREGHDGDVILIGKSMGGRIGCHVSLGAKVSALICFGYPLCGGGDPTKLRDKVLREIMTPILFVQGTRDSLCPLDLLDRIRPEMRAPNQLQIVEGGDHSLGVSKRQLTANEETQGDVDGRILETIRSFLERHGAKADR
ncbi:MAG: dienelactone hydrolase family protein [Verrucomicrobiota bacterium]|nr:dienelactone hydrolase family protein [Verrucomicrobiota bacterium]